MTSSSPEASLRTQRLPRTSRDPLIRVAVALSDRDDDLVAFLRMEGFQVDRARADALDAVASSTGAEAIVLDADLEGALAAVTRVRKNEGVVSTVPIVLIGAPGASLRTSLDAVDAGGDAFVPRPVTAVELATRLLTLLELPGSHETTTIPPPPRVTSESPTAAFTAAAREAVLPPSLAPPPDRSGNAAGLSPALAEVLRAAAVRAGGTESEMVLPSLDDDAIDELIPPELLEPLDAPLDTLTDEALSAGPQHTPPPYAPGSGSGRRGSSRGMVAIAPRVQPTPTITPLAVGGEMRLAGSVARFGLGLVLGAASRARASGMIVVRARRAEYCLSVMSGHLLAIRSNRAEDEAGPLLARLGVIPREAARFAAVPLDAGVRGAALLAARGYVTAEVLAQSLARAAREMTFDLLALPEAEWEMRPLETAAEIPLRPRSLDALLVLGARARIESAAAAAALGDDSAILTFKSDGVVFGSLPLTRTEREAAAFARGVELRSVVDAYGIDVMPALLALAWLALLRVDGEHSVSSVPSSPATALALERTRVRALIEAASAHDFFALLGISEWSARSAALDALEARRADLAGLRARHPDVAALPHVSVALDELAALLSDTDGWQRYTSALRERMP